MTWQSSYKLQNNFMARIEGHLVEIHEIHDARLDWKH